MGALAAAGCAGPTCRPGRRAAPIARSNAARRCRAGLNPRATIAPLPQLLYLVPFIGYVEVVDPANFPASLPPLIFSKIPFWVVTSLIYTAIAALAACLCLVALHNLARRQEKANGLRR